MTRKLDPVLLAMLADVADNPSGDPLPQMALADYITDRRGTSGPGAWFGEHVRRDGLPRWFQRGWAEARRKDPLDARGAWGGLDVEWVAFRDLSEWFTAEGRRLGFFWYLDTWCGTRQVGGLEGFTYMKMAGEPNALRLQAGRLSSKTGCVGVVLLDERGGGDVLLLPTPKLSPRTFRSVNRPRGGQE
jgi:hypothetical protein